MPLADVQAMHPGIDVAQADFEADRRLLEAIADWCDRYTPLVGLHPPDGLTLDVTGCAHLFGGEAALCRDLVTRLARQGFCARLAIADTVGGAWAVARYGERAIVPRGEVDAAVQPLPIAALRIDLEIAAELASLGLKRIADLAARPRAPLAARFGETLVQRLDQALGREDEPITPRLPLPVALAERRFAEPIAREADVLGTIEHLAHELGRVLERRGEGARLIQLALFRTDGKVHRLEIGTGAPLRDPPRVRKLFEDRLAALGDACDPGFGYDVVRLAALVTERGDPVQTGLAAPDHEAELAYLIDRLGARFGLRRVTRLVPQNTHIPEYAVAAMPAHAALTLPPRSGGEGRLALRERCEPGWGRASTNPVTAPHPRPLPTTRFARGRRGAQALEWNEDNLHQDSLGVTRPIRLLQRPEPIEVTAEVPDGPPVRFDWRRVKHHVAHAEGPERIAMEWWRDRKGNTLTRDYFRVESHAGARVWLYREGLYGETEKPPRWYLHGLFA